MSVNKACRAVPAFIFACISCGAQQSSLTVDAVLSRVRQHIADYKATVPDFIADESVLSQRFTGGKLKDHVELESSFEVKRKDDATALDETRTVKLVDGRPLKKNHGYSLPFRYTGAISNAFWFLENKCSDFRFAQQPQEGSPLILEIARKPVSQDCPSISHSSVIKTFIGEEDFQVHRVEETVQNMKWVGPSNLARLFPSEHNLLATFVDYAPVKLGGRTYWLASSVISDSSDVPGTSKPVHLHYEAHYTNYHKYASTVTILPGEPAAEQAASAVAVAEQATVAGSPATTDATATEQAPTDLQAQTPTPSSVATTRLAPEKAYAFDVASIRENKTATPENLREFGATPDGYHVQNMSLRNILMTAFAPQVGGGLFYTSDQIKGIPDWADSARYDIEARISARDQAEWQNPERQKAMLRAMIQALLADRCRLAVHREIRQSKVYSLELGKGGPKFSESKPNEVFPPGINLPWGGVVVPTGDGMRMYGTTMASFATVLAERTDSHRTIQDRTGLAGRYDITLKAEPLLTPASVNTPAADPESDWDAAMLAAVDSLGLKLVSTNAPVETLVIDRLERPSQN